MNPRNPFPALAAALVLGWTAFPATAAVHVPAAPAGVDEGALLLGELNCTACHAADPAATARLLARGAPDLSANPLKTSTAWLRRWIADPHGLKPGTAMPGLLHGLDAARQAATAENLTHYLASLRTTNQPVGLLGNPAQVQQGRALYHSLGCVACHAPETKPAETAADILETAKANAVPLGDLARKYPAGELVRFLREPLAHRPGGRMPSLNLSPAEANALAIYLLRDQSAGGGPAKAPALVGGLRYEYFEAEASSVAQLLSSPPKSAGVAEALDLSMPHPTANWGVKFSGFIEIPDDGKYRFWITSDDGAQLSIDGAMVVDNDGVHPATEKAGTATLKAGLHSLEVVYFQGGGESEFKVLWAPPATKRAPIPAEALKHGGQPMLPVDAEEFVLDAAKAAAGRRQFADLNCAACHRVNDAVGTLAARASKPLSELASRTTSGCLADAPAAGIPRFDLSPAQRAALRKTLAAVADLARPLAPADDVRLAMTRLNCFACHSRDGVGGPAASGRADWFSVVGEADLGDEGRIPPHLGGVGAKLKESALKAVLESGQKARPYMATRMPVFGPESARLAAVFKRADRRDGARPVPAFNATDAKSGWKLVGRDGLACVSCHTFTTHGSMGIPALALDKMAERLEWDWFRRYLPDPAALRPGTRMPTFWPEGQAANRTILNGNTDAQIQAVYAYLSDGAKAEVPSGLIRGKKEIVVDDEAVIYRNFLEGAGARAIGVGYPGHANLAFDAQNLRLALIWQGSFIDMARHSTDRGTGYEPPLGDHRIALPDGPSFAALADSNAPWPTAGPGGGKFLGYRLDTRQQPTFRYRFAGLDIEETPLPHPGPVDMTLVRTFRFQGTAAGPLWFRVAKGTIGRAGDGFTVDGALKVNIRGGGTPVVAGDELRVPIDPAKELVVEMTW